jgi:hypothetical protein
MMLSASLAGYHSSSRDPNTLVFLIESSPTNLDPRIGTDGQSEHIDELLHTIEDLDRFSEASKKLKVGLRLRLCKCHIYKQMRSPAQTQNMRA